MKIEDRVAYLAIALQVTEESVTEAVPSQNYLERARLANKLNELLYDIREHWKQRGVNRPGGLDE